MNNIEEVDGLLEGLVPLLAAFEVGRISRCDGMTNYLE